MLLLCVFDGVYALTYQHDLCEVANAVWGQVWPIGVGVIECVENFWVQGLRCI